MHTDTKNLSFIHSLAGPHHFYPAASTQGKTIDLGLTHLGKERKPMFSFST
jgi:hypothetical protein